MVLATLSKVISLKTKLLKLSMKSILMSKPRILNLVTEQGNLVQETVVNLVNRKVRKKALFNRKTFSNFVSQMLPDYSLTNIYRFFLVKLRTTAVK